MGVLCQFFSHIYTMAAVFFTILLLEILIFIRAATGALTSYNANKKIITAKQYNQMIEEKNPTIQYKKGSSSALESMQCSVCLSDFEEGDKVRRLKCKHTFHKDCLDKWLHEFFATCPLCRTKILPDDIVAGYRRQLQDQADLYDGSDEEIIVFLSALHRNSLHRFF
ncbi:hypothetical protein ACFE04_018450 [Oxalis oulophora]